MRDNPYRTPPPTKVAARASTSWDPAWLPLVIVLSLPLTLVLFCAVVRSSIEPELIPSTVLHGSIAYAVLVLVLCGRDLMRSN
ncbi:MAG: hypothetical protein ACLP1X_34995 [Polyangiaceae bacterium]